MLELIEGNIIDIQPQAQPQSVIIQTGGIGFRLLISNQSLQLLPEIGKQVLIYVYLHVREDELSLYGFTSQQEREFFNLLIQVSGIGPKLALGILSAYPVLSLRNTIIMGDEDILTSISGIGKKTAKRLILELKDKLEKLYSNEINKSNKNTIVDDTIYQNDQEDYRQQAIAALLALGYTSTEAYKALPMNPNINDQSVEGLIRYALKNLAKY